MYYLQIVTEFQTIGTYEKQIQQTAHNSYARHYRRMVPPLLQALQFRSNNEALQPLLRALDLIQQYVGSDRQYYLEEDEVPLRAVGFAPWLDQVIHRPKRGQIRINRISYEMCVTHSGLQHPAYKALAEPGKAVKTIFLCDYLHSIELRREIQEGLNVIENWNSANGFIFYGRGSEIATNNRQAQEISALAMHLLQVSAE